MSKEIFTPWDSADILVKAIGNVAWATGMTNLAQEAQLGRSSLYKALPGERDPRIGTVMKILGALGVRLTVTRRVA